MTKYVWVVKKNTDQVEGRGAMLFDTVWIDDYDLVKEYINKQPGYANKGGLYDMVRVPLLTDIATVRQEQLKASALAKLTKDEKEALGLI